MFWGECLIEFRRTKTRRDLAELVPPPLALKNRSKIAFEHRSAESRRTTFAQNIVRDFGVSIWSREYTSPKLCRCPFAIAPFFE